ncbi:hypothetical protein K6Y31_16775 [Motilimonas cestriensis]|uniref:Lipoprotein n=1 Tax=Motilimonas cestriensis TaxID=2742685 RepID=A0ABS8WBQ9_9GAMM|nr:hypothetical protein [Motilimonas cestriensis]MCE2596452.1 hypothetical protein [Motilimonas cestriensis]
MKSTRFDVIKKCSLLGCLVLSGFVLSGCGSSDLKKLIETKAHFTYINTTDKAANFYLMRDDVLDDDEQDELFNGGHQVFSNVAVNEAQTYSHTYRAHQTGVHLGVSDSNTLIKQAKTSVNLDFEYKETPKLWVVAWMMSSQFKLTYFGKESSDQDGVYKVRLFTHTAMPVSINGSGQVDLTTEQGKATRALAINNCASGLEVGGNKIDLCNADLGRSYLVVIDQTGLRSLMPES